jgi:poly-gamma-glutamate biosynthesis protein PgsC/CapC
VDLSLLSLSIGIGLVVSLVFSELFGLAAGGLVVPGYVALFLTRPLDVAATIAAALATFFVVRLLSSFVIVYGRRRTALMILVGYAMGLLISLAVQSGSEAAAGANAAAALATAPGGPLGAGAEPNEARVIGYIVPGLVAIWLDRQGVLPTLAALLSSAVVVRLILILTVPEDLQWFEARPSLAVMQEEAGG